MVPMHAQNGRQIEADLFRSGEPDFIPPFPGFISRKRGFISIQRRCRIAWWTVSHHPDVGDLTGKLDQRMNSHLNSIADWALLARDARYRSRELALLCQVSPRQLERYFRDRFGQTPQKWLDALRLRDAAVFILQGRHIKEVSL